MSTASVAAGLLPELITGIGRYFPNTMFAISLIGGLALGNLPWVLMGVGALILSLFFLAVQGFIGSWTFFTNWYPRSADAAILQACSIVPLASSSTLYFLPSLWVTLTTYFAVMILQNASAVYTAPASKMPTEALPVQHRKSVGMVSMLAVLLLFVLLLAFRLRTGCEYTWNGLGFPIPTGTLIGIAVGVGSAYTWRAAIGATNSSVFTDIHGVMAGLQPGTLRTNPLACAPQRASAIQ